MSYIRNENFASNEQNSNFKIEDTQKLTFYPFAADLPDKYILPFTYILDQSKLERLKNGEDPAIVFIELYHFRNSGETKEEYKIRSKKIIYTLESYYEEIPHTRKSASRLAGLYNLIGDLSNTEKYCRIIEQIKERERDEKMIAHNKKIIAFNTMLKEKINMNDS